MKKTALLFLLVLSTSRAIAGSNAQYEKIYFQATKNNAPLFLAVNWTIKDAAGNTVQRVEKRHSFTANLWEGVFKLVLECPTAKKDVVFSVPNETTVSVPCD